MSDSGNESQNSFCGESSEEVRLVREDLEEKEKQAKALRETLKECELEYNALKKSPDVDREELLKAVTILSDFQHELLNLNDAIADRKAELNRVS
jgi:hypothetical protein